MTKNQTSLGKCRQLIESSLNWGDATDWTNEDFENLSERIFDKTNLRLSVSTLKRIWGKVRYDNSPTAATLNALARFAGYSGWREFVQQHPEQVSIPDPQQPAATAEPEIRDVTAPVSRRKLLLPSITVSVLILLGLISLLGLRRHSTAALLSAADLADLKFDNRQTSDDLPNSVVFTYDAASLHPHSVIIQQSWDTSRREKVPASGKEHTSIYYYPGYFMAKLIVDGTVRKESPVFIKTKGWKGMIERKTLPIYLTAAEIGVEGPSRMGISSAVLQRRMGTALFNNTWVDFANVREFKGIPADHFTLSATLRNTSTVEQCLCRKIKITILGTDGAIIIPLADKGCISEISLLTGDRMLFGKDNDLSLFGCDFRDFQQLSCTVEEHRLKIMLNHTQIFTAEQKYSLGEIVGLRISFEGAGEIRDLSLQGPQQRIDLLEQ